MMGKLHWWSEEWRKRNCRADSTLVSNLFTTCVEGSVFSVAGSVTAGKMGLEPSQRACLQYNKLLCGAELTSRHTNPV